MASYEPPSLNDELQYSSDIDLPSTDLIDDNNNNNNNNEDVMAFDDSEPTIIDTWNAFMRKCCCCCKCKCCNFEQYENHKELQKENNWEFVDEVEKALTSKSIKNKNNLTFAHHHKIFSIDPANINLFDDDLQRGLIEDDEDHNNKSPIEISKREKKHKRDARMRCYCIPCLKYKPKIWQLISISIAIQFLAISIMGSVEMILDKNRKRKLRLFTQILLGIMWFLQLAVLIQLILVSFKKLWDLHFFHIVQLYLTSILIFTGIYSTAYFYHTDTDRGTLTHFDAFNLESTQFAGCNFMERIIAFLYLSCSQQTLCGVCEIIPKSPTTMILAMLQMLFGIFFNIIIISIGISRLGEDIEQRHNQILNNMNKMRSDYDNLVPHNWWYLLTHNDKIIAFRRTTRRYLLFIIIIIQVTKNILEWITTDSHFADKHYLLHSCIFIVFDLFNILVVLMTSLKFLHRGHMTELRLSFLCQTYLSTMLIFTGIYVDLQASNHDNKQWDHGAFVTGEETYIGMWIKFVYFSFAMMTLCGNGLHIKPRTWYAAFAVCNEMLLGLFFHAYIFGIGLLLVANNKYTSNHSNDETKSTVPSLIDADGRESVIKTEMNLGSELIMSTLLNN